MQTPDTFNYTLDQARHEVSRGHQKLGDRMGRWPAWSAPRPCTDRTLSDQVRPTRLLGGLEKATPAHSGTRWSMTMLIGNQFCTVRMTAPGVAADQAITGNKQGRPCTESHVRRRVQRLLDLLHLQPLTNSRIEYRFGGEPIEAFVVRRMGSDVSTQQMCRQFRHLDTARMPESSHIRQW